jgi:hypothetical protein
VRATRARMTGVLATCANDCKRGRRGVRTARGNTTEANPIQAAIANTRSASETIASPSADAATETIPVAITNANAPASRLPRPVRISGRRSHLATLLLRARPRLLCSRTWPFRAGSPSVVVRGCLPRAELRNIVLRCYCDLVRLSAPVCFEGWSPTPAFVGTRTSFSGGDRSAKRACGPTS